MKKILLSFLFIIFIVINVFSNQAKIDSLENLLTKEISDSLRARILYNLSYQYLKLNPQLGKKHAQEGVNLIEKSRHKEWYNFMSKSLYLNLGSSYLSIGDLDSAFYSFEKSKEINNKLDTLFNSKVLSSMGIVKANKGEYKKALTIFEENLETLKEVNSIKKWVKERYIGQAYANLGGVYYYLGNYVEAKKHYYSALEYYEKDSRNKKYEHNTISNISSIHSAQAEYKSAIILLNKALNEAIKEKNTLHTIIYSDKIGTNHRALGNLDSALLYHKKYLEHTEQLGLLDGLSKSYFEIANDYMELNIPDSSLYYFLKRYEIDLKRDSNTEKGATIVKIGELLIKHPNLISSEEIKKYKWDPLELLEQSKSIALESENLILTVNTYKILSKLYFNTNQPQKAYEYLLDLHNLKDSVFTLEKSEALADADAKYETEKKEQQLAIKDLELSQNKLLISKQVAQRNALIIGAILFVILFAVLYRNYQFKSRSNKEKESLLKEIHHRVKNNLQIIANLLYLQSGKFEDENIKNILEDGQGRVRSMALIHQKLYENEDLKSIPFGEYVLELVNEIKTSFGEQAAKVNIKVEAPEAFFDVDSAVPLGLIINELSTNAFKYAFEGRDEGQFNIFLTKSGDEYELHISDNGKGIPEDIDIRKTRSLGLRLVRILSEQLEGDYSFNSKNGLNFKLKFAA